jgi:ADP-ribosylglycohydrolase
MRGELVKRAPLALVDLVLEHTPASPTHDRLAQARSLPADTTAKQAAKVLGNGMPINSVETVPFAVWCANRYLDDYKEALWAAASVGGDMDTNCAIIGGIIALATASVPAQWLQAREKLHLA